MTLNVRTYDGPNADEYERGRKAMLAGESCTQFAAQSMAMKGWMDALADALEYLREIFNGQVAPLTIQLKLDDSKVTVIGPDGLPKQG